MQTWKPCNVSEIIEADVIRWKEAVWEKGKRGRKAVCVGERQVVGEVKGLSVDGWVVVKIVQCAVLADRSFKPKGPLKVGDEIKRRKATIGRGSPERLKWSDEDARDMVSSRFMGIGKPVSSGTGSRARRR